LYQTLVAHYESWLALASAGQYDGQGDCRTPKAYVRKVFAWYLADGIFAQGFARQLVSEHDGGGLAPTGWSARSARPNPQANG
jgi:hypothetical protein